MKKIFFSVAAMSALVLASCSKDRTCECNVTPTSGTAWSYKVTYYDAHKKDARLLCAAEATQTDVTSPTSVLGDKTTCELK